MTRVLTIAAGIVLLTASFALGYVVGGKSQKTPIEAANSLTSKDWEHAFGSAKPADHEAMQGADQQDPAALSLSSLVTGLEKKVAAHPENIEQQLLLAQTYNELDNRAKSLTLLHALDKQAPKNAQVKITLATVLMKGEDKQELKEALQMFDEAIKLKPDVASMARMYQGEVRVKLDNMSR